MQPLPLERAFTLIEPGPVVLVTTSDGKKSNVMTISWTMVLGFSAQFTIMTGAWNYSYAALEATRDCVIALPTVDMIDTVIGIGTCSGRETDKFRTFGLKTARARHVGAPLLEGCLANIECRVVDIVERHGIVVLEGVEAYFDTARPEKRTLHAVGDGTFIVDGRRIDRREAMRSRLPPGI